MAHARHHPSPRLTGTGEARALRAASLALAEPKTLDLAGGRFRQLVDELDVARVLVRGELVLDERLQRFLERRVRSVPGLEDHERLRLREAVRIVPSDHGSLEHGRMLDERALDL